MTIEQIKNDDNFLCGLELPDKKINVYLVYIGSDKLQYYMYWNDQLLFSGNDFRPSPMHSIDTLESIISLLGFLTLKKGDTDDDYFKDYTPKQWKWSESIECEDLRTLVSDYEYEDEPDYQKQAKEYFEQYFN